MHKDLPTEKHLVSKVWSASQKHNTPNKLIHLEYMNTKLNVINT